MKSFVCAIFAVLSLVAVHALDENNAEQCAIECSLTEFKPICGYDGKKYKEFGNDCEMKTANCQLDLKKEPIFTEVSIELCQDSSSSSEELQEEKKLEQAICNRDCDENSGPICGFDGTLNRTFENDCDLRKVMCAEKFKWVVLKLGSC